MGKRKVYSNCIAMFEIQTYVFRLVFRLSEISLGCTKNTANTLLAKCRMYLDQFRPYRLFFQSPPADSRPLNNNRKSHWSHRCLRLRKANSVFRMCKDRLIRFGYTNNETYLSNRGNFFQDLLFGTVRLSLCGDWRCRVFIGKCNVILHFEVMH